MFREGGGTGGAGGPAGGEGGAGGGDNCGAAIRGGVAVGVADDRTSGAPPMKLARSRLIPKNGSIAGRGGATDGAGAGPAGESAPSCGTAAPGCDPPEADVQLPGAGFA